MNKYHGWGRFIIYKGDFGIELAHSEVTQFGATVPYRKKLLKLDDKFKFIDEGCVGDIVKPCNWLESYLEDTLCFEMQDILDGYDFKLDLGNFAEITGFLLVEDTSSWTDGGMEYDSELYFDEPTFTPFKLEDLKGSYFYDSFQIAEFFEMRDGLGEGEESTIDVHKRILAEGYGNTGVSDEVEDFD